MEFIDDRFIREAENKNKKAKVFTFRRAAAILAAAVIIVITALPVLAANDIAPAYELIYTVSPQLAQKLKPVRKSCVSSGIQMEVISAYIHGDKAEVLIAVKDIEKDRIDGTVDLFDSYNIRGIGDCSGTCRMESYDKKTKTAAFMIYIQQMEEKEINLNKVTFSVSQMLTGKKELNRSFDDFDLNSVNKSPKTVIGKKLDFRGNDDRNIESDVFLKPQKTNCFTLAGGAYISAAGYIDGKLHVQAYYENILKTDNHGFLYLQNRGGELTDCISNIPFWDKERKGSYEEYVFDIPYDELSDYSLYGEITTCDTLIEGEWEVTFPFETVK